jgi:DivIVA domain-containing protein
MAADPHTDETATQRFVRSASASERLREVTFPVVMRGYDRHAVDQFLSELAALVDELESRQTREGVVQKALDELGEETAGILQRAHETADDITSRSRATADTRLQRAEREAEILRRDADEYAEQVIVDTRLLWEERQRLIEDIRQLADEVLGTADDAMERLKLPDQIGQAPEAAEGLAPAEGPAGELRPTEALGPAAIAAADEPPAGDELPLGDDVAHGDDLGRGDDLGHGDELGHDDLRADGELAHGDDLAPGEGLGHGDDLAPGEGLGQGDELGHGDTLPPSEGPTAVAPLPLDELDEDEIEATEESGHTVELEALPGGSEEPPEHERR